MYELKERSAWSNHLEETFSFTGERRKIKRLSFLVWHDFIRNKTSAFNSKNSSIQQTTVDNNHAGAGWINDLSNLIGLF